MHLKQKVYAVWGKIEKSGILFNRKRHFFESKEFGLIKVGSAYTTENVIKIITYTRFENKIENKKNNLYLKYNVYRSFFLTLAYQTFCLLYFVKGLRNTLYL